MRRGAHLALLRVEPRFGGLAGACCSRYSNVDHRSLPRARGHDRVALDEARPLLDAHESDAGAAPAGSVDLETAAVVSDDERQVAIHARERHPRVPGMAMPGAVAECLLRDAEERQRDQLADGLDVPVDEELDADVMMPLHFVAVRLQGSDEADMLQDAGMQAVRHQAETLRHVLGAFLHRPKQLLHVAAPDFTAAPSQMAQIDTHRRNLLAHVVVQVAGDSRALGLLARNQASGEIATPLLRVFRFGDVADDAQNAAVLGADEARFELAEPATRL